MLLLSPASVGLKSNTGADPLSKGKSGLGEAEREGEGGRGVKGQRRRLR